MLKLNLASGTDIRENWVNMDIVPRWPSASRGCDIVWDARTEKIPYVDNSIDEVYAGYLFLHVTRNHHVPLRDEIRRVLKPGAVLTIGEVDMRKVMEKYLEAPSDPRLSELIWGEQGIIHGVALAEYDTHVQGFTEGTLRRFLEAGGFKNIERIQIHVAEVWYELTLRAQK